MANNKNIRMNSFDVVLMFSLSTQLWKTRMNSKNSYDTASCLTSLDTETSQMSCKANQINWLVSIWYKFFQKGVSEQTISWQLFAVFLFLTLSMFFSSSCRFMILWIITPKPLKIQTFIPESNISGSPLIGKSFKTSVQRWKGLYIFSLLRTFVLMNH